MGKFFDGVAAGTLVLLCLAVVSGVVYGLYLIAESSLINLIITISILIFLIGCGLLNMMVDKL